MLLMLAPAAPSLSRSLPVAGFSLLPAYLLYILGPTSSLTEPEAQRVGVVLQMLN